MHSNGSARASDDAHRPRARSPPYSNGAGCSPRRCVRGCGRSRQRRCCWPCWPDRSARTRRRRRRPAAPSGGGIPVRWWCRRRPRGARRDRRVVDHRHLADVLADPGDPAAGQQPVFAAAVAHLRRRPGRPTHPGTVPRDVRLCADRAAHRPQRHRRTRVRPAGSHDHGVPADGGQCPGSGVVPRASGPADPRRGRARTGARRHLRNRHPPAACGSAGAARTAHSPAEQAPRRRGLRPDSWSGSTNTRCSQRPSRPRRWCG